MPPARISVVMPNYNHGRFIAQALEALFAQTRPADEIIVIDDASTDDSLRIIDGLAASRPAVSIVRKGMRGGALATLNEGLDRASGELIAFPAADDLLRPAFLEEAARLLERFPEAPFCSACVELIDGEGRRLGGRPILRPMLTPGYASAEMARSMLARGDNFFLGPVTLYRRARLVELGGFDPSLGAGTDGMMLRRMAVRWGFCFTPKVLGAWRLHGANYSAAAVATPERLDRLIQANRRVIEAEPDGLFPRGYARLFERRLRFNAARLPLSRPGDGTCEDERLGAVLGMIRATRIDGMMLRAFRHLGPASSLLSLGWLALRLRPFSFAWLAAEACRRLVSGRAL
ncbi:MAG TPA: glycosyltransferase [Alphaproteobacteria bacterium]|nr:glycosyltransferase [Alphaproteobacteria bacterium]